jgi:hypothetical protein
MRQNRRLVAACAALAALALSAYAPAADACACCAEPGQRVETTSKLEPYEKTELERLRFGKKARLFMSAAGAAGVKGVTDPTDTYELTQTRQADRWTMTVKDEKGRPGSLAFTLPTTIESFFVDPNDGKQGGAGGPLLFKEWRLTAPVTATGVFAGAATGSTVRLILQGRGNSCTSADQFSAWTLIVSGPNARFQLFGTVSAPAP